MEQSDELFLKRNSRILNRSKKVQEKIEKLTGHTIFCGFSRLGRVAAEELRKAGTQVVVVENDEARQNEALAAKFLVIREMQHLMKRWSKLDYPAHQD